MLDVALKLVDVFHAPMENDYISPLPALSFGVTAPQFVAWDECRVNDPAPFLALFPAGARLRDRWTGRRRNWAALLETTDIRAAPGGRALELRSCGEWIRIPWHIRIEPALVATMEMHWERIRQLHREAVPCSQLLARAGIVSLLARFFEHDAPHPPDTPAGRFKRRIDEDVMLSSDLDSLSRECGYSPDHMRMLFRETYGVNPQRYRSRRRMSRAMDLIVNSRLSIKEIGARMGFRHQSHFTALFCRELGMTPSGALMLFRKGR